jgi:periplasmic protein TonB
MTYHPFQQSRLTALHREEVNMAYADRDNGTFKPAGLAAATIVNGAAVAALLLIAPQVTDVIFYPPTEGYNVEVDPLKKIVPDKERPRPIVQKSDIAPPNPVAVPLPPQPYVEPKIDPLPLTPVLPKIEPVAPIKPLLAPVLKAARPDPRYVSKLQPDYPPTCARAGIEGSVTVKVRIGTDGRVAAVEVLRSDHEDFSRVTQEAALRKWRFIAATRDGEAIESWKEMTVRFQIPD